MNILNFLKVKKEFFTSKSILRLCSGFWDRYSKLFFLLFSLLILSWGVYFWFQMTYRSDWNAQQKKQYQNSQSEEVELKDQQLKRVVAELERKKETYDKPVEAGKDIFASYLVKEEKEKEKEYQENKNFPSNDTSTNSTPANNSSGNTVRSIP